jgi:hypothetical protein
MAPAKPTTIEIDMQKLDEVLDRVQQEFDAEDYAILKAVVDAYGTITALLDNKNTSIARLRKLLFGATTEKTAAVLGEKQGSDPAAEKSESSLSPMAAAEAASSTTTSEASGKASSPGHGRNGADAYTGAEKIVVPHESLQPGDPCPQCEKGTVYETSRPGVLVRLVGSWYSPSVAYK